MNTEVNPTATTVHTRLTEHMFKGACICPCPNCTKRANPIPGQRLYGVLCICPDCPEATCGAKTKPVVG